MVDLKGKVAIVTGAGRGIGKEIALSLARAGADVAVTDIADSVLEASRQIESLNVKSLAVKCDVSNIAQVAELRNKVLAKFGKIDILVNNAGVYPQKAFLEMTPEDCLGFLLRL